LKSSIVDEGVPCNSWMSSTSALVMISRKYFMLSMYLALEAEMFGVRPRAFQDATLSEREGRPGTQGT
jgi:hypothetical protein